ncbi:MAG: non-canonical purine NTP pyrophosphatase [Patescibacteria group bacterium]|nr:non-canonical purine NTP pyrophosphatase [Patescibacteria group bacterium]
MKQIHFVTTNRGKVNSVSNALSKYGIEVVHHSLELPEPRSDDLREIAKEKVLFAYEKIGKPCIALDSGFYVHSLNGFPKAFVNFALETIGIDGILRLVDGKPRDCEFRNCLAYLDETLTEPAYFESNVDGSLSDFPRGEMRDYHWSKLFLVFTPRGANKTLAEMTYEEYQNWRTQRYKDSFATKFAEWISQR